MSDAVDGGHTADHTDIGEGQGTGVAPEGQGVPSQPSGSGTARVYLIVQCLTARGFSEEAAARATRPQRDSTVWVYD